MTTYKVKDARIIDGRIYGVSITTTRQVTNEHKQTVKDITVTVDYDGMPVDQFTLWATSTGIIRQQNQVWKTMTPEQIKAYNGKTLKWSELGKTGGKSSTPSIIVTLTNIMISNGIPQDKAIERATKVANDPEKLKEMMELVGMLDE